MRRDRYAEDHCLTVKFGPNFVSGVSPQASIIFGTITRRHRHPVTGYGVNASLPVQWSYRPRWGTKHLGDNREDAPLHRTLTVPTAFHETWIDWGFAPAAVTLTSFDGFETLYSAAALVQVGLRWRWIWWSDPQKYSSRSTYQAGIGAFAGVGTVTPKNGDTSTGWLFGGKIVFGM